jgi:hypothetical protein
MSRWATAPPRPAQNKKGDDTSDAIAFWENKFCVKGSINALVYIP